MYSGTRPRDAVTNAPDLGPGGGPGARRQYFLFAGAAPMRMDWSRMIKACTQPYLCYAPTLRFTILPPPLVLLDSIFFNLSYRLCRRPSFFIFGGASTPFFYIWWWTRHTWPVCAGIAQHMYPYYFLPLLLI
jgi:hypothetical protein